MIIILGMQGSGKSVQGELLEEANGWRWLSTGQMFRQSGNEELQKRMETGELIDDVLTTHVLQEALGRTPPETEIILDGYPRNLAQAKWLVENAVSLGHRLSGAIVIDVPAGELARRLRGRSRTDDAPTVVKRRLDIYEHETRPVLDYLRSQAIPVHTVNGFGTIEEVHDRLNKVALECSQK